MTQNTHDENGDPYVNIRENQSTPSGGNGGFFSIGGGGGFGGGFGGTSRRRAKKRARARAAALALARAQAAEQARQAAAAHAEALAVAHRQHVETYRQAHESRRSQLDAHFGQQVQGLEQALQGEIDAARKAPNPDGSERWELYVITKARDEVNGLIAAKQQALAMRQAESGSFGDPAISSDAYTARLTALASAAQMEQLHRDWEAAYTGAHDARLLAQAIEHLTQRAADLLARHASQTLVLQAREAELERQRQYAEQRETRVRYKQQADEDRRLQRLRQANTVTAPVVAAHTAGVLLTRAGAQVAADFAAVIESALLNGAKELVRVAAIRTGRIVGVGVTAMLYSPALGNAELSAAQRLRHLQGLGVGANTLGIAPGQNLQAIADAGGSVSLEHRVRIDHFSDGSAISVVTTGAAVDAQVPVRNAVFDPITDAYRVDARTPMSKTLVLSNAAPPQQAPAFGRLAIGTAEPFELSAGLDLRFDDCIVCIPGQAPQYFSFSVSPAGTGVVSGKGHVAGATWWSERAADAGVALPAQVGEQLRGRTFTALPVFEGAVWQAIAADQRLLQQFDEVNQRRILNGYPPVATRADWVGERREYELRHVVAPGTGSGLYDLDQLRIHRPASAQGILPQVQPFKPWFEGSVALAFEAAVIEGQPPRTWIPLAPPGEELLGPTVTPEGPALPGIVPGSSTDPLLPGSETLPGELPGETGATIPGFGDGTELPSPGLVNNEPAKLLEVGEYKDLSRRSINDRMDVDHIVSRRAYEIFLTQSNLELDPSQIKQLLEVAPSVVIPTDVHRKYSETYGGRNTVAKQYRDAADLRTAVDSNFNALKPGLLEQGFSESEVEVARQQLHDAHQRNGMY